MTRLLTGCKINLGLRVLGKRADGNHALRSIFYPLPYPRDELTLEPLPCGGLALVCPALSGVNILEKAHKAFAEATGLNPGVRVSLRKRVPVGAGLGGASANAAAYLAFLNEHCSRPLTALELRGLGAQVGADVPFFFYNRPCLVAGKGELIRPLAQFAAQDWQLVAVFPGFSVSTAWAFAEWDRIAAGRQACLTKARGCARSPNPAGQAENGAPVACDMAAHDMTICVLDICNLDVHNALEQAVISAYPELGLLKAELLRLGAEKAAMSGSGSVVFGLFSTPGAARAAAGFLRANWQVVYHLPMRSFGM